VTGGKHGLTGNTTREHARREIKDALEWALNNRALLLAKFKEYNQ
jgi:hypothetical protein